MLALASMSVRDRPALRKVLLLVGIAGTCLPVRGRLPEALEASPVSAAVGLITGSLVALWPL